MKQSLKTKIALSISAVVLLNAVLISLLANFFINEQFNSYISRQQEMKTGDIISSLNQQYNDKTNTWNTDFIHTIGMSALYEGYIIKVYDSQHELLWDAESHDMSLCMQIVEDITERMERKNPRLNGDFSSQTFNIARNNMTHGFVNISFYGPYFLNENDFKFLDSLKEVLFIIGIFSLIISVIIGIFIAKRLSNPILKTVEAAKQISDGNYKIRVLEKADTKETAKLILSINNLAESLEKQEKLRKQLTEDVSHELRTPISILQSHVEAMIEGIWHPTTERLQSCNDEITRIGSLVGEIENLARLDSDNQKLNKSNINLSELAFKALNSFEAMIKEKNLQVTLNNDCSDISADGEKISRVIINLLSNSIKYTDNGGKIEINISETKETAIFSISDTGISIPPDELPFIFERFYRTDKSRNRKTGGSGLGLSIVKSIIEAHGGKVNAESHPNRGSCFKFVLPK